MNRIVETIKQRLLEQNLNWICVVTGSTGSGKSYCAMRLAEQIDPSFSAERICFSMKQFFELFNSGQLGIGKMVIIDEGGQMLNSRRWMTQENKLFQEFMQVVRHRNFGIIFCVPSLTFLDNSLQKLMHSWIETKSLNRGKELNNIKFFWVNWSDTQKKLYRRYHIIKRERRKLKARTLSLRLPQKVGLVEDYERRKKEFTKMLGEKTLEDLNNVGGSDKPKRKGITKKDRILEAIKEGKRNIDIAKELNCEPTRVSQLRHTILE